MNENNKEFIDRLVILHLKVLIEIIKGASFKEIETKYRKLMDELEYKQNVIIKAHRLTFKGNILVGAYPVSPKKTDFQIEIEEIGTCYAMCALDALGIPFTFNKKAKIFTKDFTTKKEITFNIDPNNYKNTSLPYIITFNKGYSTIKELVDKNAQLAVDACPTILFYSENDVKIKENYNILSFTEALEAGRKIFSPDGFKDHFESVL